MTKRQRGRKRAQQAAHQRGLARNRRHRMRDHNNERGEYALVLWSQWEDYCDDRNYVERASFGTVGSL